MGFFVQGAPIEKLRRPRYGLNSIIGQRLAEDTELLSQLASMSSLQAAIWQEVSFQGQNKPIPLTQPTCVKPETDITLALIGLLSQSRPWKARVLHQQPRKTWDQSGGFVHTVFFQDGCLYVNAWTSLAARFLYTLKAFGLVIDVMDLDEKQFPGYSSHMKHLSEDDQDAWYQSKEYAHTIKTESWLPSENAYRVWTSRGKELLWPILEINQPRTLGLRSAILVNASEVSELRGRQSRFSGELGNRSEINFIESQDYNMEIHQPDVET